jgi:NADH:ubiquinone oxidoreductase subunit 2 (subunit N)
MIPGAVIVILIPLMAAVPAFVFRQKRSYEVLMASLACGLVIGILLLPYSRINNMIIANIDIGRAVVIGTLTFKIQPYDQLALQILFLSGFILFGLSWRASQGWSFIPLGLITLAFFSASLIVRPFVFSGFIFVLAAALVAIMIQAEHVGERSTHGAMRYLTIMTLALPAFLGVHYYWQQSTASALAVEQAQANLSNASTLLGIVLVMLLGAFPLFTWTHYVANDAPPLMTAFVAVVWGGVVSFFFLALKQEFVWARTLDNNGYLKFLSIVMIAWGGLLAWAQPAFSRLVACAITIDIGVSLFLLISNNHESVEAISFGVISQVLSLGAVAVGLAVIRGNRRGDIFSDLRGIANADNAKRIAIFALCAGGLSLGGFPGSIGFVGRWLQTHAIALDDVEMAVGVILASVSVSIGFIRGIALLIENKPATTESKTAEASLSSPTLLESPKLNNANETASELESDEEATEGNSIERIAPFALTLPVIISVAIIYFGLSPMWFTSLSAALSRIFSFYR